MIATVDIKAWKSLLLVFMVRQQNEHSTIVGVCYLHTVRKHYVQMSAPKIAEEYLHSVSAQRMAIQSYMN